MSHVGVWMPVYNEERFLRSALESVFQQEYRDFTLYVSDNHSDDKSDAIIREYLESYGSRMVVLKPPTHMSGIEHMRFMWDYLSREGAHKYSIHIGGHDLWRPKHLRVLAERFDKDLAARPPLARTVAIIYANSCAIDEAGSLLHPLTDIMQVDQMRPDMIPQFVITGVRAAHFFGMWNEAVRRKVAIRHCCSGWDHFVVAEAALHGAIFFEGGSTLEMRLMPSKDYMQEYGVRHLSAEVLAAGTLDFRNQLEWCGYLIDYALQAMPESARPVNRPLLTASLVSMYIALRGYNLQAVPGAAEALQKDPRTQQILLAVRLIEQQVHSLTEQAA